MAMKKTALLIGIVLGVALEVLVLVNAQDTRKKVSAGGDIFHNQVEGLPMNVGGEKRMLAKGTYVVTRQGPVLLPWYWVYEYLYLTASLPIVMALIFFGLYFRSAKRT